MHEIIFLRFTPKLTLFSNNFYQSVDFYKYDQGGRVSIIESAVVIGSA